MMNEKNTPITIIYIDAAKRKRSTVVQSVDEAIDFACYHGVKTFSIGNYVYTRKSGRYVFTIAHVNHPLEGKLRARASAEYTERKNEEFRRWLAQR